jgi:hypothetical protein
LCASALQIALTAAKFMFTQARALAIATIISAPAIAHGHFRAEPFRKHGPVVGGVIEQRVGLIARALQRSVKFMRLP